jgi:hypothetical protein
MFGLDDLSYWRNILDCPSGAYSFVTEVKEKYGINAIGCDPLFGDDLKRLFERGEDYIEYVTQRVSLAVNLYNWDFYPSIKGLRQQSNAAFSTPTYEIQITLLARIIKDNHDIKDTFSVCR